MIYDGENMESDLAKFPANVRVYFNRDLQDRAIGLFHEALCRKGFLGIGAKESLRFSSHAGSFSDVVGSERIYQKRASP